MRLKIQSLRSGESGAGEIDQHSEHLLFLQKIRVQYPVPLITIAEEIFFQVASFYFPGEIYKGSNSTFPTDRMRNYS